MSVINKKPFIITVLDSLSEDDLNSLQSLINGNGNSQIKRSLIYGSTIPLTTADKGIKEANIRVSNQVTQQVYEGYLIYNNTYCVLIAYSSERSQALTLVDMKLENGKWTYQVKGCELSILELRSELADRMIEAGGSSSLPEVTTDDNGDVLGVVAGAWAKMGLTGKYVRIMNAPTSTTLTDEQIAQIAEGVFIQGTFGGFKNPVMFPPLRDDQHSRYNGVALTETGFIGYQIDDWNKGITFSSKILLEVKPDLISLAANNLYIKGKLFPNAFPANSAVGQLICRKGVLEWYIPVAQDGITSGDVIATTSNLGKALIDHLDVEINGYRARYEYTSGNYVVYSSKSEVDSGLKLQINMISYNTTNGELSFNQMTFTPDN